jgi:metal-responsive CopG/Arc/MetJ family transcriptional regulator
MSGESSSRSFLTILKSMSVNIEVDESLLVRIDDLAQRAQKSRYETVNEILNRGLRKQSHEESARKFAESYRLLPITQEEIAEQREWEEILDWSDE